MSDTDDELLPNSITIESINGTTVRSKAPSLIHCNLTSGAYHNNMMASNYNMHNKYMGFDQRSMYSRRETSPMSLRSLPNSRMQSQNSYYLSQQSCQGSVFNERCRSPMSFRSIGSNASVSAADIASTLKSSHFNNKELQMIKEAYYTTMRRHRQMNIGKRKNFKSIIKFCSRKSGGESGVEGSDSSHSSDDCRSTRSEKFSMRRTRPQPIDYNKYITQANDIYKENFKHNSLRNLLHVDNSTVNHRTMKNDKKLNLIHERYTNIPQKITPNNMCSEIHEIEPHKNLTKRSKNVTERDRSVENAPNTVNEKPQNESVVTLKDRFAQNSCLLPSQRFNKSVAHSTTYDISYKENCKKDQLKEPNKSKTNNELYKEKSKSHQQKEPANKIYQSDSENDEIFSRNTGRANTMQRKRILETEDLVYPERKRKKPTLSPERPNKTASSNIHKLKNNDDINFKKPKLPTRKYNFVKQSLNTDSEILISKSSQPLAGLVSNQTMDRPHTIINLKETYNRQQTKEVSQTNGTLNDITETTQNSSNVSTKPSFMKRKLFTQNLDIVDSKNLSGNLSGNSPQPKTLRACREKNKVRKLVTSQSCLSHDVLGDTNVMDLIHRIVPPDKTNVTNVLSKETACKSNFEDDDEWDVISVISTCKNDDASDTYTDEETFTSQQNKKGKNNKEIGKSKQNTSDSKNKHNTNVISQCKVVLQKASDIEVKEKTRPRKVCPVKAFWDTDLSDVDDHVDSSFNVSFQEKQTRKHLRNASNIFSITNNKTQNNIKNKSSENRITITNNRSQNIKMTDNILKSTENKENSNRNIRTRSKHKEAEADVQIQNSRNGRNDLKHVNKDKTSKPNPKSSLTEKMTKVMPPNNFNISRESLRNTKNKSSEIISDKANTSRRSIRLKQKMRTKRNLKHHTTT